MENSWDREFHEEQARRDKARREEQLAIQQEMIGLDYAAARARLDSIRREDPKLAWDLRLKLEFAHALELDEAALEDRLEALKAEDRELWRQLSGRLCSSEQAASRRKKKKKLPPLPVIARETLIHALLAGSAIWAGIGLPGLMVMLGVEVLAVALFTPLLYLQGGPLKAAAVALARVFKGLTGMTICGGFGLIGWYIARGDSDGAVETVLQALNSENLALGAVWAALHMGLLFVLALRTTDPRLAWTGNAVVQTSVTLLAWVLQFLVLGMLGGMAADYAGHGLFGVQAGTAESIVVCLAVLCRYPIALVAGTANESEMAYFARTVYP